MTMEFTNRKPAARVLACSTLSLVAACYQGVGGDHGAPAADDNGAGDDAGDDGAKPPRVPGEPEPDAPFEVPNGEVEVLPFHVRIGNLAAVAGAKPDHPMFLELYAKRYALGDHDFASGVAPNLKWTPEHMEAWVRGLGPVCNDPSFQARYPEIATDPTALVRSAFARDPTTDELAAYAEVTAGQRDGAGRHRMVCLAVLTSLEFVAR